MTGCFIWVVWILLFPLALTHWALFLIWLFIPLLCSDK